MAQRTHYTPGTFSWSDLTTPDQDVAKTFYGDLFGWEAEDRPVGEMVYSMMKLGGRDAAAIAPQPQQQREAGVPPAWNSYVTVESADAALERARRLGANVHAEAFDVMDSGRMAVVQDPQGAFFAVWEPRSHAGAAVVNAPGALTWNELATPDVDASAGFYSELFGWTTKPMEGSEMTYLIIENEAGHVNGGIRAATESEPTYWLVYFGCEDSETALARVAELGGSKIMGPIDIGPGQISIAMDQQDAVFALWAGEYAE